MKTMFLRGSIIVSVIAVFLFILGNFFVNKKAEINIDNISSDKFDHLMNMYYSGNILMTIAVWVAIVAAIAWIITLLMYFFK